MSLEEVGKMTLDQVLMALTDRKMLLNRSKNSEPIAVAATTEDGFIKGRSADNKPIKAKIFGQSKASRITEELRLKREKENPATKKRRK